MPSRRQAPPALRLTSLLVACALLAPSFGVTPAGSAAGESAAKSTSPAARPAARGASRRRGSGAYRNGQLLVRFRGDTREAEREALAAAEGAGRRALRGGSGVELWTLAHGKDAEAAAASLSARAAVEFAEPNYTITADQIAPSDPRFADQWALRNAGQSGGEVGSDIDAPRAWVKTTGSPRTVVAVVDGGVDFSHPELAKNRWSNPADPANGRDDDGDGLADDTSGWDWIADAGEAQDPAGHGTAVAGLIAAEGDNGAGTAGVMWRASLMSLRVLDERGAGDVASAIEAIDYAAARGASVINCSWGTDSESRALSDAVARAGARGALVVASAGNDGRNVDAAPRYPASYDLPNVVSVAAINNVDHLTPWSNWGAARAHVGAPGGDVLTTEPGGGYRVVSGTSAAAALVAGVAGLVKSLRPGLAPARVREALVRGARPVAGLAGRVSSGGVVSASGAVGVLDAMPPGEGEGREGAGGKKEEEERDGSRAGLPPAAGGVPHAPPGADAARAPQGLRGRPATNLPDLDAARLQRPSRPAAPPPVPSTLRNCPPHNPRCNGRPAPAATPSSAAGMRAEQVFVAAAGYRLPHIGVKSDLSLVDHLREAGGTPDTGPPPFLGLPRLYARAAGLLPAIFPAAAAQSGNASAFVKQFVPQTMLAGQTYEVSVTLKNTGQTTWAAANSHRLGSQNPSDNTVWRLSRVQLPTSVLPNETVTILFTVAAPTVAGTYPFQWQMVQDGVEWFGPLTPNVPVTVNAPSFEGWFESSSCSALSGWAWDSRRPNAPVEVDLFEVDSSGSEVFLARVVADQYRADLFASNKGDGRHAFSFAPPAALRDGAAHNLKARVANTTFLPGGAFVLSGLPKSVQNCGALPNSAAPPPSSLLTTQAADSLIKLSWTPAAGATHYRVERATAKSGPFVHAGTAGAGASFDDTGRARGVSYLYRVCSSDAAGNACASPYSNVALGTAFSFFEPALVAQSTTVKAQHFTELRQTVDAARAAAELAPAQWGEVIAAGGLVRAAHVRELRARLAEALAALNVLPPGYTDPTLTEQVTLIMKAHVEELRLRSTLASAAASNPPAQPGTPAASAARLDPVNRTGGGGVDLLSGNFNWGLTLLGLRGRAGHDLGLSLSYNSLVWTKQGSTLHFNPDEGYPAPGFRLGFPVVQPQYYDAQTAKNTYLLLTPGGSRVELRQVGSTSEYESVDSSYLKLSDNGNGSLQLWAPDGTRLTFARRGHSHYVSEVRDRNGNRITAGHDPDGRLMSVTDTLARVVNFNYDSNQNLLSITQARAGQPTHTWATFGYGMATVGENAFAGSVTTQGAQEGQALNVLTQVGLADGSTYRFAYNEYAQVNKVSRHSADDHQLAYTAYDYYPATDDCPRVSAHRDWALDWNNGQEALTAYGRDAAGAWGDASAPDGTRYQELYATSGWQKGLATATETYAGGIRQKWTAIQWTQDDPALGFKKNPRVAESNVYDREGNRRRTKPVYYTAAELSPPPPGQPLASAFGLVKDVIEYGADAMTVLRRTRLEYNTGAAYLAAHVIGLAGARYVYEGGAEDGGGALRSKVTYAYDETSDGRLVATSAAATPTQHDASFGAGYATGRGNLTTVRRWDVNAAATEAGSVATKIGYNTTGSVVFSLDPLTQDPVTLQPTEHRTVVGYGDSFVDQAEGARALAFSTFAYPTSVTNHDGYTSAARYDYDTGALRQSQSPQPNTEANTPGPVQTTRYDAAGRVERVFNSANAAYARFVYSPGQTWVQSFATIRDAATETYSIRVMDGAGRAYASAGDHPGSAGRYRAQHTVYDAMGRAVRTSNPTEVTSAWEPAGDDAAAGWLYSAQDYDWMGRPTFSRHPDGGMNQEIIYGGCGCAGGEVVTVRDAVGRRQRAYADVLGRAVKVEVYDGAAVYSTTVTTYNALDQATQVRAHQGGTAGPYQEATNEYDGHGRLWKSKAPLQDAPTEYSYNADDTVRWVRDARGVKTFLAYNKRHQPLNISYDRGGLTSVPTTVGTTPFGTTPVAHTPSVTYAYDAAGNRTSMTTEGGAGGSVSYAYDTLSRLTSEARTFPGPASGTYTLSYEYTVGGALKKVTDEVSQTSFTNTLDAAGQLTAVAGSGFGASGTTFFSAAQYRAWGALKSAGYGDTTSASFGYDARGQVTGYALAGAKNFDGQPQAEGGEFLYHADGRLRFAGDLTHRVNGASFHDRAYSYDQAGRLAEAYSGAQARAFRDGTTTTDTNSPFRQTYAHDVWGNMTGRTGRYWSQSDTFTASVDHRGRNPAWEYEAAGRLVSRNEFPPNDLPYEPVRNAYDASGRTVRVTQKTSRLLLNNHIHQTTLTVDTTYDGDGQMIKEVRTKHLSANPNNPNVKTTFRLRSTVLGGRTVSEYDAAGARQNSYVYAGRALVARQWRSPVDGVLHLEWRHTNPATGDSVSTDPQGRVMDKATIDPGGVDTGDRDPFPQGQAPGDSEPSAPVEREAQLMSGLWGGGTKCFLDGIQANCVFALGLVPGGGADVTSVSPFIQAGAGGAPNATSYRWVDMWEDCSAETPGDACARNVGQLVPIPGSERPLGAQIEMKTVPVPEWLLDDVRARILEYLSNPKCLDFIKQLIAKAEEITDIEREGDDVLSIFDSVRAQQGFIFGDTIKYAYKIDEERKARGEKQVAYSAGFTVGPGRIADGNAQIELPLDLRFRLRSDSKYAANANIDYYRTVIALIARSVIHESLHVAGKTGFYSYNDITLAQAAADIKNVPRPDYSQKSPKDAMGQASGDWNKHLEEICFKQRR